MKKPALLICILCAALLLGCSAAQGPTPMPRLTPAPTEKGDSSYVQPGMPDVAAPTPTPMRDGELRVYLINTGESDALLIKTGSGAFMVDTGLKKRFDAIEAALRRAGVEALDGVILTHGHKDHIGGLKKLLKLCPVGAIYTAALDDETYSSKEIKAIRSSGAEHIALRQGDTFSLAGVGIDVLSPDRKYVEDLGEDDNDNSLVLRIAFGNTTLLFMGDATGTVEQRLLDEGASLKADILKAGRHGKDEASLPEFIAAVSPQIALLTGSHSDGDASPHEAVLSRFRDAGITVYSNDTDMLALELVIGADGSIAAIEHLW